MSHVEQNYLVHTGGPETGQYGTRTQHGSEQVEARYGAMTLLHDVVAGRVPGRTSPDQITYFGGHGLGLQFAAVGARAYQLAKQQGLGHEIPTEWFTQTLHT